MIIEREGRTLSWINFKYERLSTFCFVCGLMGHSDRDCEIEYVNPDKVIDRAYGVWLKAPTINAKNQQIGARWLKNDYEGYQQPGITTSGSTRSNHGWEKLAARFMEIDGQVREISGDEGIICYAQRDLGNSLKNTSAEN